MQTISLFNLLYLLPPLVLVAFFYYRWVGDKTEIAIATFRMSVQLILIGYVLTSLFSTNSLWLLTLLIAVMIVVASLIARRSIRA